ncbi:hypothetical protein K504DRAFT_446264 [Pleomassaria siparia CBS 279.74]|uniref:Uncharacterized protein n=1 Tax=Pleomassaria siparia CBS 279.74 TaxID=1314801 RepID=A0A6G1KRC4_9PLEO|nr:hypothetical protein K504DRAFT_446264 [Pleomassaria siparia CBS 279.74]
MNRFQSGSVSLPIVKEFEQAQHVFRLELMDARRRASGLWPLRFWPWITQSRLSLPFISFVESFGAMDKHRGKCFRREWIDLICLLVLVLEASARGEIRELYTSPEDIPVEAMLARETFGVTEMAPMRDLLKGISCGGYRGLLTLGDASGTSSVAITSSRL